MLLSCVVPQCQLALLGVQKAKRLYQCQQTLHCFVLYNECLPGKKAYTAAFFAQHIHWTMHTCLFTGLKVDWIQAAAAIQCRSALMTSLSACLILPGKNLACTYRRCMPDASQAASDRIIPTSCNRFNCCVGDLAHGYYSHSIAIAVSSMHVEKCFSQRLTVRVIAGAGHGKTGCQCKEESNSADYHPVPESWVSASETICAFGGGTACF